MSGFYIGTYEFINISRVSSQPMTQFDREARPGVNNVTLWDTGSRAELFQILTVADTVDVNNARLAIRQYEALTRAGPQSMYFAGQLDSTVIVHHVAPVDDGVFQTLIGVGGRLGTSRGMVRALWVLEYWPATPQ